MILNSPGEVCFQARFDPDICENFRNWLLLLRFFWLSTLSVRFVISLTRLLIETMTEAIPDFLSSAPNQWKRRRLGFSGWKSSLMFDRHCLLRGRIQNHFWYFSWHKTTTLKTKGKIFQAYVYTLFVHTKHLCTQQANCYSRIALCLQCWVTSSHLLSNDLCPF